MLRFRGTAEARLDETRPETTSFVASGASFRYMSLTPVV